MQRLNTISASFAKAEMKDLLIHQIATYMKEYWSDDEVIDLFLESQFNFIEPEKSRAEMVKELMKLHKYALQNEKLTEANNFG
ncbi:MAG TPA: hypothetical protein VFM65_08790 [Flavobacteriaceae bacterium]|nr:hypothetical protein [Flavobacteriaceae bacterium]